MNQPKQSPSKMLVMLPLFFMAQKINYTDDLVNMLRLSYYVVQVGTLILAYIYIRNKVIAANDRTRIYLPPVPVPFAMGPEADNPRPKESSYLDHEMDQVNTLVRSTLIGIAMTSFMHWKMGVKPVLLLQSIMGPMNLADHGLVKKWLLGSKERVWGEFLEGEEAATNDTVPLRPRVQHAVRKEEKEEDEEEEDDEDSPESKAKKLEELLDKVFNKEASCDALLKTLTKENINYQTESEQYSPLIVLCGRPDVTEEQVKKALYLGAFKFHRDEDGCTALHWAAMKGVVAATTVLCGGTNKDVEKLLGMEDGDKKTALDLAKESVEPAHEEVEAILEAAMEKVGEEKQLIDLD